MFKRILFLALALVISLPALVAPARGDVKIAEKYVVPKDKKDMTTEQYYTSVKLDAAKAYGESLALQKQGKWLEASRYLRKCLAIRNYFVDTDKEIPALKQKLGVVLVNAGRSEDALLMFGEAIGGFARWYGPGCSQSIAPLTSTGDVYMSRQNYAKALTYYQQAYAMSQRNSGVNSAECMNLRIKLADAYKGAMQLEPAAALYKECLDRQQKNEKLIEKEQLISTMQNYGAVLKELKKDDEAQITLKRADELRTGKPAASETAPVGTSPTEGPAVGTPPAGTPSSVGTPPVSK